MLSLSQFRQNLFPLFAIMKNTGATFEVVYKGKVYDVEVRHTDKIARLTRSKRMSGHVNINAIDSSECPECGSLSINGVCMNTACKLSSLRSVEP